MEDNHALCAIKVGLQGVLDRNLSFLFGEILFSGFSLECTTVRDYMPIDCSNVYCFISTPEAIEFCDVAHCCRLHELALCLMCQNLDDLKETAKWPGIAGNSRGQVLLALQVSLS